MGEGREAEVCTDVVAAAWDDLRTLASPLSESTAARGMASERDVWFAKSTMRLSCAY